MNYKPALTVCVFFLLLMFNDGLKIVSSADLSGAPPKTSRQNITQINNSTPAESRNKNSDSLKAPALVYPDALIQELKIKPSDIDKNRSKFKNNPIHIEWMDHVHDVLPNISPKKEEAIINTHTSLLFIKDQLDTSLFSGTINKQEHAVRLTGLIKWFQEANRSVLSEKEANALFGISDQDGKSDLTLPSDGKLSFPIINPDTTDEMIKKSFNDKTIRDITLFYQKQAQELYDIKKIYETGNFKDAEAKQIKRDMRMIDRELQSAYMDYCRGILSEEQFTLLFGSRKNN
jgi:hypothetical protein